MQTIPADMEITLKLTSLQIAHINLALQELPFKIANPIMESINSQVKNHVEGEILDGSDEASASMASGTYLTSSSMPVEVVDDKKR